MLAWSFLNEAEPEYLTTRGEASLDTAAVDKQLKKDDLEEILNDSSTSPHQVAEEDEYDDIDINLIEMVKGEVENEMKGIDIMTVESEDMTSEEKTAAGGRGGRRWGAGRGAVGARVAEAMVAEAMAAEAMAAETGEEGGGERGVGEEWGSRWGPYH